MLLSCRIQIVDQAAPFESLAEGERFYRCAGGGVPQSPFFGGLLQKIGPTRAQDFFELGQILTIPPTEEVLWVCFTDLHREIRQCLLTDPRVNIDLDSHSEINPWVFAFLLIDSVLRADVEDHPGTLAIWQILTFAEAEKDWSLLIGKSQKGDLVSAQQLFAEVGEIVTQYPRLITMNRVGTSLVDLTGLT